MKKNLKKYTERIVFSLVTLFTALLFVFTSCENFLNSEEVKDTLVKAIEYANSQYADVTINSLVPATDIIVPAIGNYNNKYKKTDKIDLKFEVSSNYQFVKWIANPANAIIFDDEYELKTTAIVDNIDSPIVIEPLVYERPTITVVPNNVVENPKNSTIVISFSHPIELTNEDLKKIDITIDELSILDNYLAPRINDERTTVTFVPKRDNYIPLQSGVKIVKVFVPGSFGYTENKVEITVGKDFFYAFKINAKTETSVEITVNCLSYKGDLSFTGTKTYYLDNEFSVKCTPKAGYVLTGWGAVYEDNSIVEENILEVTTSEDGTEAFVKVLTGSERPISFVPILEELGAVEVNFATTHGYTTPADKHTYYVNEEFTISYREERGFAFTNWQVEDDKGNIVDDVLEISNPEAAETTCKVLKEFRGLKLVAKNSSRPKIIDISPTFKSSGDYRDSRITILFGEKMSEDAIYWTKEELEKEEISEDKYEFKKYNNDEKRIYAYKENGDTEGKTIKFKNIEIYELGVPENNFLKYYGAPFFESSNNNILIIPAIASCVPEYKYVNVIVKSSFFNANHIPVDEEKLGYFFTNNKTDDNPPDCSSIIDDYITINGKSVTKSDELETDFESAKKVKENFSISINGGKITDSGSQPASLQVKMEPLTITGKNGNLQKRTYIETVTLIPDATSGVCDFKETPLNININLKDKYEGAYKISFTCFDNRNNSIDFGGYDIIYDDGINPEELNPDKDFYCPNKEFSKMNFSEAKFGLNNISNCQYRVYFNQNNAEIAEWYSSGEIKDLNNLWDDSTKPSLENREVTMHVVVRDAFTEKTFDIPLQYSGSPTELNVSKTVVIGRGTYLNYTLKLGEDLDNVKYVYTDIKNEGSSSGRVITGVEVFNKYIGFYVIDNGIELSAPLEPNKNGTITFKTLYRGLDGTIPIIGSLQFEDDKGKRTTVYPVNIRDTKLLSASSMSITGRGTIVRLEFELGNDCENINRIYTKLNNEGIDTGAIITCVLRENDRYSIGNTGYSDSKLTEPLYPDENGTVIIGIGLRDVDANKPIEGTIQLEDSEGNITSVIDVRSVKE